MLKWKDGVGAAHGEVFNKHEMVRINDAISRAMTVVANLPPNARKKGLFVHALDSPIPKRSPYLQLLIHKETRHSLTRPDAHTRQQDLLLLSSAFAKSGADLSGACSSQRVSQRDGSTSDVHFRGVDA